MKYGYECKCGWSLGRGRLTRKQYAEAKVKHAKKCGILRDELEASGKTVEAEEEQVSAPSAG